jgi:hypothetical protein
MPVTVLFKALDAGRQPVSGRTVTGRLRGPDGWLTDHTGAIITDSKTTSGEDGQVQLQLTPQAEIAATGTCYEIHIADTFARFYCVVPVSASPVQLADILVDPDTLEPVSADTVPLWLTRAELGQPGGVAPLDDDGLVPAEHLPAGSGGGAVDSVNGHTGVVVLAAADVGAVPVTRQVLTGGGLEGGGTLEANRTIVPGAAMLTSLGKADTAVQPDQLAPVATAGTYASLTGKPTIPATYADLTGVVPSAAIPEIAITRYLGAAASQAAMLALTGELGDWCTRTDLGTNWVITGTDPSQLGSWTALTYPAAPVQQVNGHTGNVTLGKADVGLGNVVDLAPADLPVSDDQQAAIDTRVALAVVDAAGDLIVGAGADTVTRLAIGADGQALIVNGGALTWDDLPAGGGLQVDPVAARYGCLALTMHPHVISWNTPQYISMFNGRHYMYWVPLPAGTLVTGVRLPVQLAGSGAGEVHFGIYNDDNSQLGVTGDVAALLSGAVGDTWQNIPLTAAAASTGPGIWITGLSTMDSGTAPKLVFSNTTNLPEWLLNDTAGHPTALRREGVSALPATLAPSTAIPYIDFAIGVY